MAIPQSARAIVNEFLSQYGLGDLAGWAWNIMAHSGDVSTGMAEINAELPNTPQFKTRFPAYDTLAKQGRAMTVQQMLDYEKSARQIMHDAGIPPGFYDQPEDFARFMERDVSVSELQKRVQIAAQETLAYNPAVVAQLRELYGIGQGHLIAHALDPNAALPLLEQQHTAAQIAAQAKQAQVAQLTRAQAENLTQLGVTEQQAQAGFQTLGQQRGLFEAQTTGEQTVGLDTQLAAEFGNNTVAQLEFKRRAAQREAEFQGRSGFGVGQQGVGGLTPQRTA